MEPFRIITTIDELAALRIDSIVCPPRLPSCAYRKAWAAFTSKDGRADLFVTFESTREVDLKEVWAVLTMHCPEGQPSAWVLWDPAAEAPALKPSSWTTVIPSRRPARKAHTSLGYAKAAITHQMSNGTAREDMVLQQLNPATGTFEDLFTIPQGTAKTNLPW